MSCLCCSDWADPISFLYEKSRNDGTRDTTPATQCTTVISIFIRCLSELTTDTEDLHTLHFNVGLVRITISVTSSTIQTESAGRF